jgi:uncharacterized protein YacL
MPRHKNEWDYLIDCGPLIAAERIKSYATSMGVVAALVGVMSVQAFMAPTAALQEQNSVGKAFAILCSLAIACTLFVVVLSTIMYCQIGMVISPSDTEWLLRLFSDLYLYDVCTYTFALGISLLLSAVCVASFQIYSLVVGLILSIASAMLAVVLFVFFFIIDAAVRRHLAETVAAAHRTPDGRVLLPGAAGHIESETGFSRGPPTPSQAFVADRA